MNPKLRELREQAAYLGDEIRALHESAVDDEGETRSLDQDEEIRFDEGTAMRDNLIAEADKLEKRLAAVEVVAERPEARESGAFEAPNVTTAVDVFDPIVQRDIGVTEAAKRYIGETRFLTDEKRGQVSDLIENRDGTTYERNPGDVARHALAHGSEAYNSAFAKIARGEEWDLDGDERAAMRHAQSEERAMSLTDASGGYLVPTHLDPTVIATDAGAISPIRQLAKTVSITGDNWNGVSSSGVTASWDTEASEVSDDAPTFVQPSITPVKGAAFVPISYEALEDISNIGAEVSVMFSEAKNTLEAAGFATGTGSDQPNGIVVALTAGGANPAAMATNSAFAVGDLFTAAEALPARYRGKNPTWVMNQTHINDVMEFGGTSYYTRSATLDAGPAGSILGQPVFEASDFSATLDGDSNYNIVYGDWSNYVIADRIGASVRFIPDLFATGNNRPSGQSGWYLHWRVGADSVNDSGFVLLTNPSTL